MRRHMQKRMSGTDRCAQPGNINENERDVERNPVRALMVERAEDYRWSSARAHLTGLDESGVLDMEYWRREGGAERWRCLLADRDELAAMRSLEASTFSGRPFGDDDFVQRMASEFQREWPMGRKLTVAVGGEIG